MIDRSMRPDRRVKTSTLLLLACLTAACSTTSEPSLKRMLTFTNQCCFDVWIQSVGSNASVIPCSPTTTSAQANCPTGFVCYARDANTNYCVPGTTSAMSFPVSNPSEITLDASECLPGDIDTDTSTAQWGQCTCTTTSDCPTNQICRPVDAIQQCFWGFQLANDGQLSASGGQATLVIDISSNTEDAIIASGKFFAKTSCDANGNCLGDNTQGAPAALIEYTFQNNNDFYDVSYINGINAPVTMYPEPSTTLDYQQDDPYRCMAAGGDGATIQTILAYQKANNIQGNDELEAFACANDYASTFTGPLTGFNFVYTDAASAPTCTSDADCSGTTAGATCGLCLETVQNKSTTLTCGDRLGYWSYQQFCAAQDDYSNTDLGVDCADAMKLAYAECVDQPSVSDQGPGRSCFNANTTVSGDTCCGYEAWSQNGAPQPMAPGSSAVSGVDTTYWRTNILPAVQLIKDGCYLAYSYPFDDPFSTFTCATTQTPNLTNYNITLCPGSNDAGIDPPPPPTCTPSVPTGYSLHNFTIGIPDGYSIQVDLCDTEDMCTTPLSPSSGDSIFTARPGTDLYQVTATENSGGNTQACLFSIPENGCIGRVSDSAQCQGWVLATTGAWVGRSIAPPAF